MSKLRTRGIKRLINAFYASRAGLAASWRNEEAFRQEVIVAVCAVPLALLLGETGLERAVLIGSVVLVVVVELLNSAIEATVDRIGLERHELSGQAKDMGSAAVLISSTMAALVWVLIGLDNLAG